MKKSVRILAAVLMTIMALLSISGCALSPKAAAEAVIKETFDVLMSDNIEKIKDELQTNEAFDGELEKFSDLMIELLFKNLDYTINDVEVIDDNTVDVSLSITNTDMKSVFTEFIEKITAYAMEHLDEISNMTEEETIQLTYDTLEDILLNSEHGTVTIDVIVTVSYVDSQWQIEFDDEFIDAILGGFVTASESMGS